MNKFKFPYKEFKSLSFLDHYNWRKINFPLHQKKAGMRLKKIIKQKLSLSTLQFERSKT